MPNLPKLGGKIPWFVYIPAAVVVALIIIIVPIAVVLSRPQYKCPPTVSVTSPTALCSAEAGTFRITGDGFGSSATVFLVAEANRSRIINAATVTYENSTSLTANFLAQSLPAGFYRVFVRNAENCQNEETAQTPRIEVRPVVLAFFVDPPVIYNGVRTLATAFTSGLNRDVVSANLITATSQTPIGVSNDTNSANRYLLDIPAGVPAGTYQVSLRSASGCSAVLTSGIQVVDTLTLNIGLIEPNYVWNAVDTAVTITATGGSQFQQVPRVYLTTSGTGTNATARLLDSVNFASPTSLTAVIPSGLELGEYDVLVVNPNGAVGLRSRAITVVAEEPPVIDAVTPSSFAPNAQTAASITGARFAINATVGMNCTFPGTDTIVSGQVTNVVRNSSSLITATFAFAGVGQGFVCVVRVTNPSGSNFLFSAISTKSPSSNLNVIARTSSLNTARSGHAAVTIKPTRSSKFLLAISGNQGNMSQPIRAVEGALLDRFANLGNWTQRSEWDLPVGLSYASAINVGAFVYVIGGYNGTHAVDTVYRSMVLDPKDVVGLDVSINVIPNNGVSGFTPGLYFYSVSALLASDNQLNPGGETLAAPAVPVNLPNVNVLEVAVQWQAFPGAVGYRIYRSPTAGASVANMELLAEIQGSAAGQYNDNGTVATNPSFRALSLGAIGKWVLTNDRLLTARYAHTQQSFVPNDPQQLYLWVFTGRGNAGLLNNYEYLVFNTTTFPPTITTSWTAGALAVGGAPITAVAHQGSFILTSVDLNTVAAGTKVLYLAGGEQSNAVNTDFYGVGLSGTTPVLGSLQNILAAGGSGVGRARTDFCSVQASGYLNIIGGGPFNSQAGDTQIVNAQPASVAADGISTFDSNNWNPAGALTTAVRGLACVTESANIFFVGGRNNGIPSNVVSKVPQ